MRSFVRFRTNAQDPILGRNALVGERLTVSLGRSRPYWVERQTGFYLFEEDVKDPQKLPAQWARLRSQ
jgi:hypothetical protein